MNTSPRFSILFSVLTAAAGLSTIAPAQTQTKTQALAPAPTACPAAYFSIDTVW